MKTRDPAASLGKFGEVEKEKDDDASATGGSYFVWFDAEGECEFLPGDKLQVVSTHPVKKEHENE